MNFKYKYTRIKAISKTLSIKISILTLTFGNNNLQFFQ